MRLTAWRGGDVDSYQIRVHGRLDQHWAAWFEGLALTYEGECTVLRGPLVDETALYGVLAKVRDLNVRLLAVQVFEGDGHASAPDAAYTPAVSGDNVDAPDWPTPDGAAGSPARQESELERSA